MTLPTLDIVIVNWNTGPYLRDCLRSVAQTERNQFELVQVVVVDNASTDDSLNGIEEVGLPLRILRNSANRGFGAACNQGAKLCSSDLLLLLNPDTRVLPDTIDRTVAFLVDPKNEAIGICSGRMVNDADEDEFSCWRFPTFWMWVAKLTGLAYAFPGHIRLQRMTNEEVGGSAVVDQVIGAYNLIRRSLFEELNGFDERFFLYLEDVDFAYRARQLGYASFFLADVPIYHVGGVSSDQVRARRLFYLIRGRTEYARKHWPHWQAALLALLMLVVEFPARGGVALARGDVEEARGVGEAAARYAGYLLGRRTD